MDPQVLLLPAQNASVCGDTFQVSFTLTPPFLLCEAAQVGSHGRHEQAHYTLSQPDLKEMMEMSVL